MSVLNRDVLNEYNLNYDPVGLRNISLPDSFLTKAYAPELSLEDFSNRLYDIFYKDTSEDDRGGRSADRDAFIDSMSDFYRFNNVSEHKPFKVDMEPVLKEIPIKLTPFSEWISQQDWNEELDTTAG